MTDFNEETVKTFKKKFISNIMDAPRTKQQTLGDSA